MLPRAGRLVLARLHRRAVHRPDVRQRRRPGQGPADAGPPLGQLAQPASRSARRSARRSRRRSASPGRPSCAARTTSSLVYFGDGATLDRRVPHRHELRRRVQGAVRLPLPQQRLGDQRARREQQTARETFADKAIGLRHARRARRRQRRPRGDRRSRARRSSARARGEGPTLIEALTYRMRRPLDARDDPTRLPRPDGARAVGASSDPIERLRALPRAPRPVDASSCESELAERDQRRDHAARRRAPSRRRRPALETMFDDVYAELPLAPRASSATGCCAQAARQARRTTTARHARRPAACP